MGHETAQAVRECMYEFRSCIKQGDFLQGGSLQVGRGCFGNLQGRLAESRMSDSVAAASTAQTRTQELQQCLMECEIFKDDTSHVTFGCMSRLEKCRQNVESQRGSQMVARGHLVELSRFLDELVPIR
mmetsp:Transcript_49194/g.95086  ORF Transcript_49194/g.95086 Transcript_49194/m.95086 type:complete len:128 (+) Transcript_49194:69-452(+)